MADFFENIIPAQTFASALHQAKLRTLQQLQRDYQVALPYFWAVFEVYQNKWDHPSLSPSPQFIGGKDATHLGKYGPRSTH
jgi:hypothetical protein